MRGFNQYPEPPRSGGKPTAQVWTYWMAPPLLAVALALLVATSVGYYRKVTVPRYMSDQQRRLEVMTSRRHLQASGPGRAPTQPGRPLPEPASGKDTPLAA